eukprot:s33_g80.t1
MLQKAPVSAYSAEGLTPEKPYSERLRCMQPVVLDQTVREPATYTPFGRARYMKLPLIQSHRHHRTVLQGSYTPETQILEEMVRGEKMDGTIAMFSRGHEDGKAGVAAMKEFKIPIAFLDTTMKSSQRFADSNFVMCF